MSAISPTSPVLVAAPAIGANQQPPLKNLDERIQQVKASCEEWRQKTNTSYTPLYQLGMVISVISLASSIYLQIPWLIVASVLATMKFFELLNSSNKAVEAIENLELVDIVREEALEPLQELINQSKQLEKRINDIESNLTLSPSFLSHDDIQMCQELCNTIDQEILQKGHNLIHLSNSKSLENELEFLQKLIHHIRKNLDLPVNFPAAKALLASLKYSVKKVGDNAMRISDSLAIDHIREKNHVQILIEQQTWF